MVRQEAAGVPLPRGVTGRRRGRSSGCSRRSSRSCAPAWSSSAACTSLEVSLPSHFPAFSWCELDLGWVLVGHWNYILTAILCLERGGNNNDLGEKLIIFRYNFGKCLVFVVGEVGKVGSFLWRLR